jgi:hypothetical protein
VDEGKHAQHRGDGESDADVLHERIAALRREDRVDRKSGLVVVSMGVPGIVRGRLTFCKEALRVRIEATARLVRLPA